MGFELYDVLFIWDVNVTTRIMENSGGTGFIFGDGYHDPTWIFTDVSLTDTLSIAIDGIGDHTFQITGETTYDLPGVGLVDVWILEDLTYPGEIVWYEKSTGILLNGTFRWSSTDYYIYDFVFTNAFGVAHDLDVSLEVPDTPKIFETFTISATATNTGENAETGVDLYLYLDNVIVDSITDYSLSIGENATINYEWTPTEMKLYNFTAYAPPVSGESYFDNNYATEIINSYINYTMFPGHPYSWISASGGTELFLGDDDYTDILLPFNFTFYDQTFSTIYLSSNGYLSFTDTSPTDFSNDDIPSDDTDHYYLIAPFWDDIYPPDGGHIYNQSFGTYWVAAWVDIYHIGGDIIGSFEVVLYDSGEIVFNYDYLNYTDGEYTCGLNLGVDTHYYNSYQGLDNLTDDFAIRFSPDALHITNPDSSSLWITGTSEDINWASTGTISNVKIELFKADIFEMEIIASTANDGEYTWTIPSGLNDSTQYQIKISDASDPLTYDYSPNFEIFTPTITILTPDSSSVWKTGTSQNINWTSTGNISNVKIELYKEGVLELEIVASTDNDGNFIWAVPKELKTSDQYQIKIIDASNPSIFALSDYFKIKKPKDVIPGYNIYILVGLLSIVCIILIKRRHKITNK